MNTSLRELYLMDNQIGPVGAQAFAEALQKLNLGQNRISDVGEQAFHVNYRFTRT